MIEELDRNKPGERASAKGSERTTSLDVDQTAQRLFEDALNVRQTNFNKPSAAVGKNDSSSLSLIFTNPYDTENSTGQLTKIDFGGASTFRKLALDGDILLNGYLSESQTIAFKEALTQKLIWSDGFKKTYSAEVGKAFEQVYGEKKTGCAFANPELASLQEERLAAVTAHERGEPLAYGTSIDSNGYVLIRTGAGEVKGMGPDGSAFVRRGEEIWYYRADGAEVHKVGRGAFKFRDANGLERNLEGEGRRLFTQLENLKVEQAFQARKFAGLALILQSPEGIIAYNDAISFKRSDKAGNTIIKDSEIDGTLFTSEKDAGRFVYNIWKGKLYHYDIASHRRLNEERELPVGLMKNSDGSFQMGSVRIDRLDCLHDIAGNIRFENRSHKIGGFIKGQSLTIEVGKGQQRYQYGKTQSLYESKTDTYSEDTDGKNAFAYNFNTQTLQTEGVTFGANETYFHAANITVGSDGAVRIGNPSAWYNEGQAERRAAANAESEAIAQSAASLIASIAGKWSSSGIADSADIAALYAARAQLTSAVQQCMSSSDLAGESLACNAVGTVDLILERAHVPSI